jgi:hypothetical protein
MSTPDPNYQAPQPNQQQYPPPPPPPYGPYGYQYAAPRPTNGMAIAAMVCGIVGVCSPLGILGVIFGTIAKRQIRETGEGGDGLATAGVVTGWIGIAATIGWIIYYIVMFAALGAAVNELEDWPSDFPTTDSPTWAIDLLAALL